MGCFHFSALLADQSRVPNQKNPAFISCGPFSPGTKSLFSGSARNLAPPTRSEISARALPRRGKGSHPCHGASQCQIARWSATPEFRQGHKTAGILLKMTGPALPPKAQLPRQGPSSTAAPFPSLGWIQKDPILASNHDIQSKLLLLWRTHLRRQPEAKRLETW